MYQHILVPLDDSELADMLMNHAVTLAASIGARMTFLTVCEDYGATGEGALQRSLSPELFREHMTAAANAILARAAATAGRGGVAAQGQARIGARPFELIVQVAEECGCDLIVMASHGRRGFRRLVIGSQTRKVLDHARTPVLVVDAGKISGGSGASGKSCSAAPANMNGEGRS